MSLQNMAGITGTFLASYSPVIPHAEMLLQHSPHLSISALFFHLLEQETIHCLHLPMSQKRPEPPDLE